MTPDLPQPFEQEDIRKDPKAVVIGLLIGLLLLCVGAISFLFYRVEQKEKKIYEVYNQMVEYRTEKANYYERMILYKIQLEQFKADSARLKQKTEPLVQKILE